MDFRKSQGLLATSKSAIEASGAGHVCPPTWGHREYYQYVPGLFPWAGMGLHQPYCVAQTHPSVGTGQSPSLPLEAEQTGPLFPLYQSSWVKERPLLTSCCKNFRMGSCCRQPQSQATFSWGRGRVILTLSSAFPEGILFPKYAQTESCYVLRGRLCICIFPFLLYECF